MGKWRRKRVVRLCDDVFVGVSFSLISVLSPLADVELG